MNVRLAALLIPLCLPGQSVQRHKITGSVVNSAGEPLQGAWIDHTGNNKGQRMLYSTDARGQFELWTGAPAVVIRKGGYESCRLQVQNTRDTESVHITLRPADVAVAKPGGSEEPLTFKTYESHDVDYSSTVFAVKNADGQSVSMLCGQGPSWSWGVPSDWDVWRSVEYHEVMAGDSGLVDAWGKFSSGRYWRYRGVFGRSCSYSDLGAADAELLDRLMGAMRHHGTWP